MHRVGFVLENKVSSLHNIYTGVNFKIRICVSESSFPVFTVCDINSEFIIHCDRGQRKKAQALHLVEKKKTAKSFASAYTLALSGTNEAEQSDEKLVFEKKSSTPDTIGSMRPTNLLFQMKA